MLVTLDEMKDHLGITDNTYDDFLTEQLTLMSSVVENYCKRQFKRQNYTQEFLREDFNREFIGELYLYHYPLNSIISFQITDDEDVDNSEAEDVGFLYRFFEATGLVRSIRRSDMFSSSHSKLVISYNAGYSIIPPEITYVVKTLVEQQYNKKTAGISLDFGSDVQGVTIPGTIQVQYDFTLDNNSSAKAFGAILGNTTNILDMFRSERKMIGTFREGYVY